MNEKEFIENAIGEILNYNSDEDWLSKKIDEFLTEFHKEYYEVEFVNIKETENAFSSKGIDSNNTPYFK